MRSIRLLTCFVVVHAILAVAQPAAVGVGANLSESIAAEQLAVLRSDAPKDEKAIACKQLAIHGSSDEVSELAKLLSDPQLSSWARIALEAIPGPETDKVLRDATQSLEGLLLVGTINSIGVRQDADAVDLLTVLLQDHDTEVAAAAAIALGHIGNDEATESLRQSLTTATAKVRSAIAEGCVLCAERLFAAGQLDQAASVYDEVREAKVPQQRVVEAIRGAILARGQRGIPLLVELFNSPDETMFQLALSTVREFPGDEVDEVLATQLTRATPERAALMIQAMSDRKDSVVLTAILEAAIQGPQAVRLSAIEALGRVGDVSCLPSLLSMALEDDSEIADAAKETLHLLPGEDVDTQIAALLSQSQTEQLPLLIELVGQRRIDAVPFLLKSLEHSDESVRKAALAALGETAEFDNLPVLLGQFLDASDPEEALLAQQALKAACIRMPDREACAAVLIGAFESTPSLATKIGLLEVLATVGGERALATVGATTKGSDSQLVDISSRLLGEWMTKDAAPVLLELAKTAPEEKYQIRALRGYIRIARQFILPEQERAEMCRQALEVAHRPEELKLVLDVLKLYPSTESLELANQATGITEVKDEATHASKSISEKLDNEKVASKKRLTNAESNESNATLVNVDRHAPTFRKIQLSDQFYSEGATCGDIDGDGHKDFIGGPYWFAGPDFSVPHEYRPAEAYDIGSYSDNFFSFSHDFNQDGRVDILIVGMPGEKSYWFENPGNSEDHWQRRLVLAIPDNESPSLVDLIGDKQPELICQSEGHFGFVKIPSQPSQSPWPFLPISPDLGYGRYTHGLGRGDLNGDGRMDLLEKNGWWEQPAELGKEPVWEFHPFAFSESGGAQMHAYDFDGDEDQDVVTSKNAHGYGLSWFENLSESGPVDFREHAIMIAEPVSDQDQVSFSQLHALAMADINQDGILDIVTGKRFWAHGGKDPGADEPAVLYWFETVRNNGSVEFRPHLIDRNSGVGTQVEATDINGDGLVDVLVGNKKGLYVFLQNK